MFQSVTLLALGLASLTLGAEGLVRGASRLAGSLGLSPLFIGLTLVAYGTSSPELVVSTTAALRNLPNVAVGNIVGSNIFNTGVVLGVSALITPLRCDDTLIRRDAPAVVAVTLILVLMCVGGLLNRAEALLLLAGLVLYTGWAYRSALRQRAAMPVRRQRSERVRSRSAGSWSCSGARCWPSGRTGPSTPPSRWRARSGSPTSWSA
jgi:cation:H+ antiporter